jgi:hypothetical protein
MKKKKKIENNFSFKAPRLKSDPDSKFVALLFKLADQYRSKHIHMIKNGISNQESKTFFLLKKLKQYSLEVSADDERFTVKDFIKNVEDALMTVMKSPDCYNLLSEIKNFKYKKWNEKGTFYIRNVLKELNISDLFVIPDSSGYLDNIYKKGKLFQKDQFGKVVAYTRLSYAYLILDQLLKLRDKIEKDSKGSSIWIDAYKIGVLQGNLGLIESFLDPAIMDIHFRRKAGKGSQSRWDEKKKYDEEKEKPIVNEIEGLAVDIWDKKKKKDLHDAVAKEISNRLIEAHPETVDKHGLIELVRRTIRPMARERNLLRGVPFTKLTGKVEKVDEVARYVVVKSNEEEKIFFVNRTSKITKGVDKIQIGAMKKGMNASVRYRVEKGKMVAKTIEVLLPQ